MKNRELVLGLDPGLAATGWGVVAKLDGKLKALAWGAIKTKSSDSLALRLQQIYQVVDEQIHKFNPDYVAVEELYMKKNISSALPVAHARGVLLLCSAQSSLPLMEFSPLSIKKSVVGTGTATKDQVQQMLMLLCGLASIPQPNHAADALAVAITAINHRHILSLPGAV